MAVPSAFSYVRDLVASPLSYLAVTLLFMHRGASAHSSCMQLGLPAVRVHVPVGWVMDMLGCRASISGHGVDRLDADIANSRINVSACRAVTSLLDMLISHVRVSRSRLHASITDVTVG